jgi:hypothetical protein
MKLIIDADPFAEMYFCGNRDYLPHPVQQLNGIIKSGKLNEVCKKIK